MEPRPARLLIVAILSVVLLGSLALGGCSNGTVQSPIERDLGTVTAKGTGKVSASPDMAEMTFGGTRQNADPKVALSEASKAAAAISNALQKAGVDQKDIQTRAVSVYPISGPDSAQITGYQADLNVNATVRDLKKLGDIITAASSAGASNINGPMFDVSDDAPYEQDAIKRAVADAREQASALAKAADKSVGPVVRISTTASDSEPIYMGSADASVESAKVPIEPGQLDITVEVTVVYELK